MGSSYFFLAILVALLFKYLAAKISYYLKKKTYDFVNERILKRGVPEKVVEQYEAQEKGISQNSNIEQKGLQDYVNPTNNDNNEKDM